MPVLDLSTKIVGPEHAYVQVVPVMLAPNDLELHREYEKSVYAQDVIRGAIRLDPHSAADLLRKGINPRLVLERLAWARRAPKLVEVQRKLLATGTRRGGAIRGITAAMVLKEGLRSNGSAEGAISAIAESARANRNPFLSEATVRKDWQAFRDVSHIWLGYSEAVGAFRWTVSEDELKEILGRAEHYRQQGESRYIGKKHIPLLRESAWRFFLPPGIILPECDWAGHFRYAKSAIFGQPPIR